MPNVIIPTDTIFGVKIKGATERVFSRIKREEERERNEREKAEKQKIEEKNNSNIYPADYIQIPKTSYVISRYELT